MRYLITFAYKGTAYHGWQVQPNGITVQEVLDKALSTLLRERIETVGAGRTDAGVHARMMTAHFDTQEAIAVSGENLIYRLNKILPKDIAAKNIREVSDDFSARFSAVSRTYKYYVCTHKDPFATESAAYVSFPLDIEAMNSAARLLIGTKDFTSFSKANTDTKTNICNLTYARWEKKDDMMVFTITANRFLRNMVRAIVGTLLDIGRGKISEEEFGRIIEAKDRCKASTSAPAEGLYLVNVAYQIDIL